MFLIGQGTSAQELLSILSGYGFELYRNFFGEPEPIVSGLSLGEVVLKRRPDPTPSIPIPTHDAITNDRSIN